MDLDAPIATDLQAISARKVCYCKNLGIMASSVIFNERTPKLAVFTNTLSGQRRSAIWLRCYRASLVSR